MRGIVKGGLNDLKGSNIKDYDFLKSISIPTISIQYSTKQYIYGTFYTSPYDLKKYDKLGNLLASIANPSGENNIVAVELNKIITWSGPSSTTLRIYDDNFNFINSKVLSEPYIRGVTITPNFIYVLTFNTGVKYLFKYDYNWNLIYKKQTTANYANNSQVYSKTTGDVINYFYIDFSVFLVDETLNNPLVELRGLNLRDLL